MTRNEAAEAFDIYASAAVEKMADDEGLTAAQVIDLLEAGHVNARRRFAALVTAAIEGHAENMKALAA